MKKIFRLIAALAATTVAFSCMEEANPETPETGKTNYDGPVTTLEFTLDELETKTAWDGENHTWSEGDKIKIIWMDAEGKTGDVTAEVVDGKVTAAVGVADTYYAVYPETTEYTLTAAEGETEPQFTVTIPQYQNGSFKEANIMAANTSAEDKLLAFKNITHIFKFTLSEGCEYKRLKFISNGDAVSLNGSFPIAYTSDSEITFGKGLGTSRYHHVSTDGEGPYYIGFLPNADMTKGFAFAATKSKNDSGWEIGALSTTSVSTKRSGITDLGQIDSYLRRDWYIKRNGNGKGTSWDDAANINLLVKLLGPNQDAETEYNQRSNAWRLLHATIHMAEGSYDINSAFGGSWKPSWDNTQTNYLTIRGGYPDTASGTDIATRDVVNTPTIFTAPDADNNARIFDFSSSTIRNFTFDGITFQDASETVRATRGKVLYGNNAKGTITFQSCRFLNLYNSNSIGGSVIDLNNNNTEEKAINLKFIECTFDRCVATEAHGGAIIVESTSPYASLEFSRCNFTNNTAKTNGGVVNIQSGIHRFTECIFSNNDAKYGAAIYNKTATCIIDNCKFENNGLTTGYQGGAIFSVDAGDNDKSYSGTLANLYVYNSYFYGNQASNQGTIRANGAGYAAIVNSTFNNNTSGNGDIFIRSGISAIENAVKAYIINCTANADKALYNQDGNCYCYNTVLNGYYANGTAVPNTELYNCIFTTSHNSKKDNLTPGLYINKVISESVTDYAADLFGTYTNGIVPVGGAALTHGMSSTDLAALGAEGSALMTAMPLFDASKLTVDQKGNSREGKTIMGAYVGE